MDKFGWGTHLREQTLLPSSDADAFGRVGDARRCPFLMRQLKGASPRYCCAI